MAKQKNILKIEGTIGSVTYYERKGKFVARKKTSLNAERIKKDKAFERTRGSMSEFAAGAITGKALRTALAAVLKEFADWKISGRLTKIFYAMVQKGNGVKGKRSIEVLPNKDLIVNFNLDEIKLLNNYFNADYNLNINAQRNMATMTVPDFDTSRFISAPTGATHFRLLSAIGSLSNYSFNASEGKYEATDPSLDKLGAVASSVQIPLGGMVGSVTTLTPALPGAPALTPTVGLVTCVGIEFLQLINGNYYLLSKQNAMKIADVL